MKGHSPVSWDPISLSHTQTHTHAYTHTRVLFPMQNIHAPRLDVRNWFSNIEQHASEGVNKILIGNKCDMEDKRVS